MASSGAYQDLEPRTGQRSHDHHCTACKMGPSNHRRLPTHRVRTCRGPSAQRRPHRCWPTQLILLDGWQDRSLSKLGPSTHGNPRCLYQDPEPSVARSQHKYTYCTTIILTSSQPLHCPHMGTTYSHHQYQATSHHHTTPTHSDHAHHNSSYITTLPLHISFRSSTTVYIVATSTVPLLANLPLNLPRQQANLTTLPTTYHTTTQHTTNDTTEGQDHQYFSLIAIALCSADIESLLTSVCVQSQII